ncbi:unnamed protein product [Heligmosomoides polygyrus]|uniref:Uncharacterized protein n=1 Tax=Heligmosomoides polygyrus TaxID=6339 RepID=A0A183FHK3_HELPZ|nr:unnamed protein product [Heligmosomoides polygyrus]
MILDVRVCTARTRITVKNGLYVTEVVRSENDEGCGRLTNWKTMRGTGLLLLSSIHAHPIKYGQKRVGKERGEGGRAV